MMSALCIALHHYISVFHYPYSSRTLSVYLTSSQSTSRMMSFLELVVVVLVIVLVIVAVLLVVLALVGILVVVLALAVVLAVVVEVVVVLVVVEVVDVVLLVVLAEQEVVVSLPSSPPAGLLNLSLTWERSKASVCLTMLIDFSYFRDSNMFFNTF